MIKDVKKAAFFLSFLTLAAGCANNKYPPLEATTIRQPLTTNPVNYNYRVGPGDQLQVFVWRNPELSTSVSVRPDGKVTSPLIEDISVSGKTPTQVARDFEKELAQYIRDPIVTVLVEGFTGPYSEQVRIVGEASQPQALAYREDMTLLDVMITVGGLTEFASGNSATLVRVEEGAQKQYSIRLEDLVEGDISANSDVLPGDVIIVPEATF